MKRFLIALAMLASVVSCKPKADKSAQQTEPERVNPLLVEWTTPYGIPPFGEILPEDFIPAIEAGIAQQRAEIDSIIANPDKPTFENTIAPLELSGGILARVEGVLYNIVETDTNPELEAVMEQAIPLLSAHSNDMAFNKDLYKRIEKVWKADKKALTREEQMVLKGHYEGFAREGIGLSEEKQARLREINTELASKTQKIGLNILAESNAFKEKFGFSVSEYPTRMTTTEDRNLRKAYFEAYSSRGHNDNAANNMSLVLEVLRLRAEKAKILGYRNFAQYQLADKMAHDPKTVDDFLSGIMKSSVEKAKEEVKDMEAIAHHKIEPWDWWYYSEKVRKSKYAIDEDEVRQYFHIDNVVKGIFTCAELLYGIHMEKLEDVPSYNKDCVTTWKIVDDADELVGIFTTDYHPRASKRGGAWMNNIRNQYFDAEGNEVRPIIVNVGNLPEYLSVDDVQTVFHEFGHALHGLLTRCHYASISGTSVTHDFVEMFSQFNENWAFQPWLLEKYARNAKGEVIPAKLVKKINASLQFNQGFMTTELAAAALLDMKWHELDYIPTDSTFVDRFEKRVCREMGLIGQIIPRYRTTYFNHIFASGYSAGYYGYLWAEVLDKDAFSIFEERCTDEDGKWDIPQAIKMAQDFKETFLEAGGSEEPMVLYKRFAGREPDSAAMLRGRGLLKD